MKNNSCNSRKFYIPSNDYALRKTITFMVVTLKTQKALIFRVPVGIKKTETPIFQGISVVLPKLYLGGRSEEARTPDILLPKQARYQLRYTPIFIF